MAIFLQSRGIFAPEIPQKRQLFTLFFSSVRIGELIAHFPFGALEDATEIGDFLDSTF
jgi:hypothetical protein